MNKIEDIYTGMAQHLIAQIDDTWIQSKIEVEFFEDSAEFDVTYLDSNGNVIDLEAGYKLFMLFKELYTITTENSEDKWNRATFSIEPSGKFNIDFEWDQDLADEIERLNNE